MSNRLWSGDVCSYDVITNIGVLVVFVEQETAYEMRISDWSSDVCSSDLITIIQDGNTTLEHNIPQSMLYEDVLSFFSQTGVGYTPTLGVTYGGPGGEPYWIQESQVWKHPLLTQHVPTDVLNAELVRVETAPEEDYADQVSAQIGRAHVCTPVT